jgi:hypothetical protein|uniref:Maturation n=1 Tax=Leviviridae sp. TaxID=2027243 RepID=A0A514CZC9_9VIRU|nr:MAG: hypothetical protein H2BulkLitter12682_000004 [Leviviridae sp.]
MTAKTYSRPFARIGTQTNLGTGANTLIVGNYTTTTSITGGFNPKHRVQESNGENSTTILDVNGQQLEVEPATGMYAFRAKSPPGSPILGIKSTGGGLTIPPTFNGFVGTANADTRATRALYAKIRDLSQQFAGGVFAGEIRQTIALVSHPANSILNITKAYLAKQRRVISSASKRGTKPKALRKAIANGYLEWTFGVQPLIGDLKDASVALQRLLYDAPRRRFSATGNFQSGGFTVKAPISQGQLVWTRKRLDITRQTVRYYGMFQEAKPGDSFGAQVGRIADLSGFNLRQFVPTIWELIPYSFLVDYFVNVGEMLEAASTDTSQVRWLNRVSVEKAVGQEIYAFDAKATDTQDPAFWEVLALTGTSGGYTATATQIHRQGSAVPFPEPRINLSQSGSHLLNLAALILSRQ